MYEFVMDSPEQVLNLMLGICKVSMRDNINELLLSGSVRKYSGYDDELQEFEAYRIILNNSAEKVIHYSHILREDFHPHTANDDSEEINEETRMSQVHCIQYDTILICSKFLFQ